MTKDEQHLVERMARRIQGELFPRCTLLSDTMKLLALVKKLDATVAYLEPFEKRVKGQRECVKAKMAKLKSTDPLAYSEVLYQRKLRRFMAKEGVEARSSV